MTRAWRRRKPSKLRTVAVDCRLAVLVPCGFALAWLLALATPAAAQALTGEIDVTAGASTDEVAAYSTQARLFGASHSNWRYYAELTWGGVNSEYESDAFLATYPYDKRVRPMETFGEKMFKPGHGLLSIRGGRYRTPFGIYARSEQGYIGFLRAPLIRYGENFALANTFLEAGAHVVVGTPSLQLETSFGSPDDEGGFRRATGFDQVVRGQAYYGDFIVGGSYLRTQPSDPRPFATGRMIFRGIDARWMHSGVELRGEWIDGKPFDTVTTRGGYLDVIVHNPMMGPVTGLARIERLDYDAGPFSEYLKRLTVGARIRFATWITGQVNLVRQPGELLDNRDMALDVAVTLSKRF
jgi:hypothetical protein